MATVPKSVSDPTPRRVNVDRRPDWVLKMKERQRAAAKQEAEWAARSGPVTVRQRVHTPENDTPDANTDGMR